MKIFKYNFKIIKSNCSWHWIPIRITWDYLDYKVSPEPSSYQRDLLDTLQYYTIGWISIQIQEHFRKRGIWLHNYIRGECTRDFECCSWKILKKKYGTGIKLQEYIVCHPKQIYCVPYKYRTNEMTLSSKLQI